MINLFKKIFRIEHVRSLGRAGLIYFDGKNEFYVESENLLGETHDIAIYYEDIKPIKSIKELNETDKKQLVSIVKKLLEKDGVKVDIYSSTGKNITYTF